MGGKLVLSGLKHMPPAPVALGAAGDQAVPPTTEDDMLTNGTKRVGKVGNEGAFNVGRQLMDVHRSELAESAGHRLKVFSLGFQIRTQRAIRL